MLTLRRLPAQRFERFPKLNEVNLNSSPSKARSTVTVTVSAEGWQLPSATVPSAKPRLYELAPTAPLQTKLGVPSTPIIFVPPRPLQSDVLRAIGITAKRPTPPPPPLPPPEPAGPVAPGRPFAPSRPSRPAGPTAPGAPFNPSLPS